MKTFKFTIDTNKYEIAVNSVENDVVNLTLNGKNYAVVYEREKEEEAQVKPLKAAAKEEKASVQSKANIITSPLPGTILSVEAKAGQQVKCGETIVVLESMKMENNIMVEKDGVIKAICVEIGQNIMQGTPLFELE
ncbi:MAG: biotin/lipoyl-binding protein [Bacteroidales bacterium]|jgi:biotin carboxyl carrier protein|nr:biotin/lipoyl-binding protein [Bacteroidales bacterium]